MGIHRQQAHKSLTFGSHQSETATFRRFLTSPPRYPRRQSRVRHVLNVHSVVAQHKGCARGLRGSSNHDSGTLLGDAQEQAGELEDFDGHGGVIEAGKAMTCRVLKSTECAGHQMH